MYLYASIIIGNMLILFSSLRPESPHENGNKFNLHTSLRLPYFCRGTGKKAAPESDEMLGSIVNRFHSHFVRYAWSQRMVYLFNGTYMACFNAHSWMMATMMVLLMPQNHPLQSHSSRTHTHGSNSEYNVVWMEITFKFHCNFSISPYFSLSLSLCATYRQLTQLL